MIRSLRSSARTRARLHKASAGSLGLFAAWLAASWASADAGAAIWQVRELTQRSPSRLLLVGGWFVRGSDDAELARARALCETSRASDCGPAQFAPETPPRRVYVRSFEIDRLEVSSADYQGCVSAGGCLPPRTSEPAVAPEQPVVQVTWREARDYCRHAGGDLPTEAQWEYAAHGDSRRSFPWGDQYQPELASGGPDAVLQGVTAYAKGRSFFGLLNMAGNVWELVLDRYVAPYSEELLRVDPVQRTGDAKRVLRGGSFRSPPHMLRARYRAAIGEREPRADVGFRCAYAASRP